MSKVVYEDRDYKYVINGGEHYPPYVHVKDKKERDEALIQFHSGGRFIKEIILYIRKLNIQ